MAAIIGTARPPRLRLGRGELFVEAWDDGEVEIEAEREFRRYRISRKGRSRIATPVR